jgi:hypothetical protein
LWLCTVTFVSSSLFVRRIELSPKTFGPRELGDSVGRVGEAVRGARSREFGINPSRGDQGPWRRGRDESAAALAATASIM